ncbi:MAG TPA: magnesium chelatase subunit D [Methylibium sp.]|uniref:magnesium chelatase subunit D n=1 Tax=Methylibium sp. TaxID=2067992 RepID=UPI002DC04E21|nr:magnesium chelatase subunit D [Methylibium sp.]HEU4457694.1 magnesium chelatase subunit D [Methylibium sp.]
MHAPAWPDALDIAALAAVDPGGLGGVLLRARPGLVRDAWLEGFESLLARGTPVRRLPSHADASRRLGGLDLAATLSSGRPVAQRGVYAEAHGGWLFVPMAERLDAAVGAELCRALDTGEVVVEREGVSRTDAAGFGVVAFDEGEAADDARAAPALRDRLAFELDLASLGWRDTLAALDTHDRDAVQAARQRLLRVTAGDDIVEALCAAALALGVGSLRAPAQALRAARVLAALKGRDEVSAEDAARAAQLVLASRATRLPNANDEAQTPPPAPPGHDASGDSNDVPRDAEARPLDDVVLEAAQAAIPADLLAALLAPRAPRSPAASAGGRAGALQASRLRGRPLGAQRGEVRGGARLALVATLRAAAPWQPLRRASQGTAARAPRRVEIRRDDLHVRRYAQRRSTTTVFVVDASGSSALHRLAEAKGAVERLLADCYVRRDSVALIAFRGAGAQLLLPPTRSLVRAKRGLAGLPGGGGTPLAAGLDAASALVASVRRRGDTPVLVLLTDGRANVARDGRPGREQALADALASARLLGAMGVAGLVIDTAPCVLGGGASPPTARLAEALGARHLSLPQAGSGAMSAAARAVALEATRP